MTAEPWTFEQVKERWENDPPDEQMFELWRTYDQRAYSWNAERSHLRIALGTQPAMGTLEFTCGCRARGAYPDITRAVVHQQWIVRGGWLLCLHHGPVQRTRFVVERYPGECPRPPREDVFWQPREMDRR